VLSVITIGIDPTIELGPVTLAWHGIMIAVGIAVGALLAARVARSYGLDPDPVQVCVALAVVGGIVGGRLLYLAEKGRLDQPAEWLGTNGFSFNGGLVLSAIAIGVYIRRRRLALRYLDALAVGLPLGIAIGRIGDVIYGEHYGPPTNFVLGVRNTHPDADVPSPDVAYHSGGLYDLLIGLIVFAVVWPLRHRLRSPTQVLWLVLALIGLGRFVEFFAREDSDTFALGLSSAQWTSLMILAIGMVGAVLAGRHGKSTSAASRTSST
jgi:phosphatidylglycerol---prolipoprotein diacylglyceryl transferase